MLAGGKNAERAGDGSRTDEVAVLEVEAVELVAGRLCVHYVFIDNEGGSLCVVGNALADLAATC